MTCRELLNLGLEEFDLKEEDTKMFDYHNDSRFFFFFFFFFDSHFLFIYLFILIYNLLSFPPD